MFEVVVPYDLEMLIWIVRPFFFEHPDVPTAIDNANATTINKHTIFLIDFIFFSFCDLV